ncbi:MAG: PASTA domain-containing protein [Bacteroidia bacterium]|nr:MAG: PASTA domain-containing protein [Bacteroidia bacterium]
MKQILKFYLFHFIAAVLSVVVFLVIISFYLDSFTKHNEYIETPELIRLPLKDAVRLIESKKLKYTIIDSIYKPEEKPGIVIAQNPDPHSKVKENRTVYITITSFQPPKIEMPKLVDMSERQAVMIIKSYGLRLGKIIYEPSDCNGCVIKQMTGDKEIKAGDYVKKGSTIDIVVGKKDNLTLPSDNDTIKTKENPLDNFQ